MIEIDYEEYKKHSGERLRLHMLITEMSGYSGRFKSARPKLSEEEGVLILLDFLRGRQFEKEGKQVYEGNGTYTYRLKI